MVIGGNEHFHGAPILSALGAENTGVDLVYPFIPPCHAHVARTYSLNFIVHYFAKTHLSLKDVKPIIKMSENVDAVVIGPGLGTLSETQKAIKSLLKEFQKPTIIDASALMYTNILPEISILTPHRGEFKRLTGEDPTADNVQKWAVNLGCTIVCKGPKDIIANEHEIIVNETGTPLMTVGGTGDVLAGFIGGLIAQGYESMEACQTATYVLGKAGESIAHHHCGLKAHDLTKMIPSLLYEHYVKKA